MVNQRQESDRPKVKVIRRKIRKIKPVYEPRWKRQRQKVGKK